MTVGEAGVTVEEARLLTDPARGEVDMVFQFEHVRLDHGPSKWDLTGPDLLDLMASPGRWQAGLAEVGWNSHDQPRLGDDGGHRVASATCTRGRNRGWPITPSPPPPSPATSSR